MKQFLKPIVAIICIAYGVVEASLRPHRYFSGLTFVGLGLYALWRSWQFRKDPTLQQTQRFTLTNLLFWVAILLAGVLMWWAVQAR